MEEAKLGIDVERRGLLIVEGAQPLQPAAAGRSELDALTDDIGNGCALAHLHDVLVTDAPRQRDLQTSPAARRTQRAAWGRARWGSLGPPAVAKRTNPHPSPRDDLR